jgi:chromosome partitioning protein
MTALTISLGIQKGGCSKTSTSGILIHLMNNDGKKVLAIDMDSQGNLTELLTSRPCMDFEKQTILEAITEKDPERYIYRVSDKLDLLPANNLLAMLPRHLYQEFGFNNAAIYFQLSELLKPLKDKYDFIIIDTPPALSEHTLNALVASDFVIVMYESSQWCYSAIPNFMGSVEVAKNLNPNLRIAGILRTLNDVRRYDAKEFNEMIQEEYPELVFETIIRRKAATGRLPIFGFEENKELTDAIDQFVPFYKELLKRVQTS